MDPRKKDPARTPATITSAPEGECNTCPETGESSCPKSDVSRNGCDASC